MIVVNVTNEEGVLLDRFNVVEFATPEFVEKCLDNGVVDRPADVEVVGSPLSNGSTVERLIHNVRLTQ
jgi:hypothetical protein